MSSGYLSLHIMGLSLGTIILPPSPSFFRKQQAILSEGGDSQRPIKLDPSASRQKAKTTIELFSYALVWWTLLALVRRGLQVSRRMVSLAALRCTTQDCSRPTDFFFFLDAGKFAIYSLDRRVQYFVHPRVLSHRYDLFPYSYLKVERSFGSLG